MTNRRLLVFKGVLWALLGLGAGVGLVRFVFGLGATTALTDTTPWGLWIGFDVMGGVALAAGGFVVAAIVHIFHRERYHELARPAILTAFLGYAAVVVGLMMDLGLPWHIWHPVFFWNPRSALFEVAWCVMLYLTVLALEVAPFILERTPFRKAERILKRFGIPVIVLGIMLSTLHQSSLGSLLLIMPFRVHPLWYTPWLPYLFFVSAICLGFCMVMFESSITSWLYRRQPEMHALTGMARMASVALGLYAALRLADMAVHGALGQLAVPGWPRNLFVVELALSVVIPVVIFAAPRLRNAFPALWFGAGSGVLGFVLNRINAAGLSQVWTTGELYLPSWMEVSVSLAVVSAFALIFFFIQEHFPVNPAGLSAIESERAQAVRATPRLDPFTQVWLGADWRKPARIFSLLVVVALAGGLALTPRVSPAAETPVQRARGASVLRIGVEAPYVYFDHERHQQADGGRASCGRCHHLHMVGDIGTPCSDCHRARYVPTTIFDHARHGGALGGNRSCERCHGAGSRDRLASRMRCSDCHERDQPMMAAGSPVRTFASTQAPAYMDAMHGLCAPCHRERASGLPEPARTNLARCAWCHDEGNRAEQLYRSHATGVAGAAQ